MSVHRKPQGVDPTWNAPPVPGTPPAANADYRQSRTADPPVPKRRRRVFWWVFAAVQVAFIAWTISGGVTASNEATQAGRAGGAIGVGLIIGLWVAADVIIGGTYAVYRLASRDR